MAAPHVAGTVALIKEANPDLTVSQIKTILTVTSKDLGDAGKDTRYGWGLINAYEAVSLAVSGDIPENIEDYDPGKPWAYIVSPKSNQSIWGDAVTVVAGATINTTRVAFQYKLVSGYSEAHWITCGEDSKAPFSIYWDVTDLRQGVYRVRAVAYDAKGNTSIESSGIKILVYSNSSDILEYGDKDVNPIAAHS
jgi:hypothetical protein